MHTPWTIRAVQLDLARQCESLPSIEQLINDADRWGCNTLALYLEGSVRTPSFPYPPPKDSYDLDTIRHIGQFAAKRDIQVVPVVSTLGHVAEFVEHKELAHLKTPDASFGGPCFDTLNESTYEFLDTYLGELLDALPGSHLHVGCDEAWGMADYWRNHGMTFADGYVAHLLRMREIATKHGRRMWIWDDFFEYLTDEEIQKVPRDIVLCHWSYLADGITESGIQGHFNNLRRRDWLPFYEKEGFDVIVCPSANRIEGVVALTDYAQGRKVLGGLQTAWELKHQFLPIVTPGFALATRLWSGDIRCDANALDRVLETDFAVADPPDRATVIAALHDTCWPHMPVHPLQLLRGPLTLHEQRTLDNYRALENPLAQLERRAESAITQGLVTELRDKISWQIIFGELRGLLSRYVDPRFAAANDQFWWSDYSACLHRLDALQKRREQQWQLRRSEFRPAHAPDALLQFRQQLEELVGTAEIPRATTPLLSLQLFLYECFSAPRLTVRINHGDKTSMVLRGTYKPLDLQASQFLVQRPIPLHEHIDSILVEVDGIGEQGICYLTIHDITDDLVPVSVRSSGGTVRSADALLTDDAFVTYAGNLDTHTAYLNGTFSERSWVEVELGRQSRPR